MLLEVGRIIKPHGIRGDLYFRPHNPKSRAFDDIREIWIVLDGPPRRYQVTSMRPVADAYVAHLAGVDDREAAAALTLAEVRVARGDLPPLGPGEYFVEDIVGCAVEGGCTTRFCRHQRAQEQEFLTPAESGTFSPTRSARTFNCVLT